MEPVQHHFYAASQVLVLGHYVKFEHTLCTCSLVYELIFFSAVVMFSTKISEYTETRHSTRLCFHLLNYSSL